MGFNEGDVGLSGGIQVTEAASLHPVLLDRIYRFGGSCSEDMQWPEETATMEEEDKYDRMERLVKRVLKRITKHSMGESGKGKHDSASGSSGGAGGASGSSEGREEDASGSGED